MVFLKILHSFNISTFYMLQRPLTLTYFKNNIMILNILSFIVTTYVLCFVILLELIDAYGCVFHYTNVR